MKQRPRLGDRVHYLSFGTPGGEYPMTCRCAEVTETARGNPELVGLLVMNPTGLFFRPIAAGGSEYDPDLEDGGSWHWPEDGDHPAHAG